MYDIDCKRRVFVVELNPFRPIRSIGGLWLARSQDFVQEGGGGPTWGGPKVPPTKNQNLLGFGTQFFGYGPIHFLFSFFYEILFDFSAEGAWPRAPTPTPIDYVPGLWDAG